MPADRDPGEDATLGGEGWPLSGQDAYFSALYPWCAQNAADGILKGAQLLFELAVVALVGLRVGVDRPGERLAEPGHVRAAVFIADVVGEAKDVLGVAVVPLDRDLDDDLNLRRIACPLGVLAVVFEARPDAVPQIAGLALKSGNAAVLKGGREALHSNRALVAVLHRVLAAHHLDPAGIALLEQREELDELLAQHDLLDLIIARGGKANIELQSEGTAPASRSDAHNKGEVIADANGDLWVCIVAGSPGTWRHLAGTSTSGSLHLITPKRVYDSRPTEAPTAIGPKTSLAAATRTIDCTGNSSGVPSNATGLLLNVTAVTISANGFLAVTPGGAGFTGTSTLNWAAAGTAVANSVTVAAGAPAGPAPGPAGPPPGVDQTVWESAQKACATLAPGPTS